MGWADGTLYSFDVESTGIDVFTDRVISATVVELIDGEPADKRTWLIDPGIDIPAGATAVHGITTEHAREHGQDPAVAIGQIVATVAGVLRSRMPLVVFNAPYDLTLLQAESARHNDFTLLDQLTEPDVWHRVLDPFVLCKGYDHLYKRKFTKGLKYTLPDLCGRYKVALADAHEATADATASAQLAIALSQEDPYLREQGPEQIFQIQRTWRRALQDSLRGYFDKNGIDHDGCDGGWPLHTDLLAAVVSS